MPQLESIRLCGADVLLVREADAHRHLSIAGAVADLREGLGTAASHEAVNRPSRIAFVSGPATKTFREVADDLDSMERWLLAGFHEVKAFLERVVAARSAEHGAWKPSPEASDLHEQIFLSWNGTPPVWRLQTELWTCRGIRPTARPEES